MRVFVILLTLIVASSCTSPTIGTEDDGLGGQFCSACPTDSIGICCAGSCCEGSCTDGVCAELVADDDDDG